MSVYDEVQCEEVFVDGDDRYGVVRMEDREEERPESFGLDNFYDINE